MAQKAHLNGSRGTPKKAFFDPKNVIPDFPILTSVGGPWDRNLSGPMRDTPPPLFRARKRHINFEHINFLKVGTALGQPAG